MIDKFKINLTYVIYDLVEINIKQFSFTSVSPDHLRFVTLNHEIIDYTNLATLYTYTLRKLFNLLNTYSFIINFSHHNLLHSYYHNPQKESRETKIS